MPTSWPNLTGHVLAAVSYTVAYEAPIETLLYRTVQRDGNETFMILMNPVRTFPLIRSQEHCYLTETVI